jgi:hypothetical protein
LGHKSPKNRCPVRDWCVIRTTSETLQRNNGGP